MEEWGKVTGVAICADSELLACIVEIQWLVFNGNDVAVGEKVLSLQSADTLHSPLDPVDDNTVNAMGDCWGRLTARTHAMWVAHLNVELRCKNRL